MPDNNPNKPPIPPLSKPMFSELWPSIDELNQKVQEITRSYVEHLSDSHEAKVRHAQILNALLTNIGDGILALDQEQNVIFCNPAAIALTGYDYQLPVPFSQWTDYFDTFTEEGEPYRVNDDELPIIRAMNERISIRTTFILRSPKLKEERCLESYCTPILVDDEVLGSIGVYRDITELKRNKQRYLDLYERAPCGYHSMSISGTIYSINQTECQWLGYSKDELIEKINYTNLVDENSKKNYNSAIKNVLESKTAETCEFEIVAKDGSKRPVLTTLIYVEDPIDKSPKIRASLLDISKQSELKEERNNLAAILSHDLKNHLSAELQIFDAMLKNKKYEKPEELKELIAVLRKNTHDQYQLVTILLDLIRHNVGGKAVSKEPVSLKLVLEEALSEMDLSVKYAEVKLNSDIDEADILVNADDLTLKHIFLNLLHNAVKSSESGEIVILRCITEATHVTVEVEDFGVGITKEQIEDLVKNDWRAQTDRYSFGGTGVGLFLCHSILERIGGKLGCRSKEKGSCFWVSLPTVN